jgi:hypothetical protein
VFISGFHIPRSSQHGRRDKPSFATPRSLAAPSKSVHFPFSWFAAVSTAGRWTRPDFSRIRQDEKVRAAGPLLLEACRDTLSYLTAAVDKLEATIKLAEGEEGVE